MIAKRVIFTGRVQGVGFRYTTKEIATGFDVCGTVKNQASVASTKPKILQVESCNSHHFHGGLEWPWILRLAHYPIRIGSQQFQRPHLLGPETKT